MNLKNTFFTLCLWGWDFVSGAVFFLRENYSSDLFFDVLIIGLFQIYVFTGKTHGEVS